ncbi:FAD-dependent oxidoreductase, partial [Prauserella alba]
MTGPDPTETEGPDLVVAGAGGGLAGALRAAEHGLSVLVVEASEHFRRGNNTSMSTAMFPGAGSRWQADAGIDDGPERFVGDIMAKTHGTADPRLAGTLAEISAPLVEWLADSAGLPLSLVTDFNYPGHTVPRCHTIPGRHGSGVIDHLARRAGEHPGIELLAPARLTDVRLDDDGAVRAVVVRYPDGAEEEIPTRAVLLATNGFGADRGLVAEHLPEIAGALYQGGEHSLGDALRIGRKLGAASGFLDAYQGHGAVGAKSGTLVGWATIIHGGILVDLDGRRFGDETRGYSEYAAELAARRGATGWIVIDETIHRQCLPFRDFQDNVDAGAVVWGADATELAEVTGLPAAALPAEV